MVWKILYPVIIFLFMLIAFAAPENEYKITYAINIKEDGTAIWNVEYRTLLTTKNDFSSFENYTQQLNSLYLIEFKDLMQKSASQAAIATSRNMVTSDFSGNAEIRSSPTGTYGVVQYSFRWTNFAKTEPNLVIGDAFIGGLYLSKDNTLIIRYPSEYTVEQVIPQPDLIRGELVWYGLRSFGVGEPRIVLAKDSFSWLTLAIFIVIAAIGAFVYMRKIRAENSDTENLTETDLMDLEDRILKLLEENGGSLYQSKIVKKLSLPKSTVSSALNELYNKNLIQKIKKGRENLIRRI